MISSILYCNLSYGSTTTFQNKQPAPDLHKLDKLDLNKDNWPKIKEELKKIEWKKAVKDLTLEGFNDFLQDNHPRAVRPTYFIEAVINTQRTNTLNFEFFDAVFWKSTN